MALRTIFFCWEVGCSFWLSLPCASSTSPQNERHFVTTLPSVYPQLLDADTKVIAQYWQIFPSGCFKDRAPVHGFLIVSRDGGSIGKYHVAIYASCLFYRPGTFPSKSNRSPASLQVATEKKTCCLTFILKIYTKGLVQSTLLIAKGFPGRFVTHDILDLSTISMQDYDDKCWMSSRLSESLDSVWIPAIPASRLPMSGSTPPCDSSCSISHGNCSFSCRQDASKKPDLPANCSPIFHTSCFLSNIHCRRFPWP